MPGLAPTTLSTWSLFGAGTPAWRPRSARIGSGYINVVPLTLALSAGWHAIVVASDSLTGFPSGTVAVSSRRRRVESGQVSPVPPHDRGVRDRGTADGETGHAAAGLGAAAEDFVLSVSPATWFPIADGLGAFGPSSGAALGFDPNGTPPGGGFLLPGFVQPATAIGLAATVQHLSVDPAAPLGFALAWPRRPAP